MSIIYLCSRKQQTNHPQMKHRLIHIVISKAYVQCTVDCIERAHWFSGFLQA